VGIKRADYQETTELDFGTTFNSNLDPDGIDCVFFCNEKKLNNWKPLKNLLGDNEFFLNRT